MDKRKFYVELSSGSTFEISELDFNVIDGRIRNGKTNGWYVQRDENFLKGDRHGWKISFKDIATVYSGAPENKDRTLRDNVIDLEKHKSKPVGKKPEKPKGCGHDWNNPEDYTFITKIHDGRNRYYKHCAECGGKSQLIKKREVELAMENDGLTINDVPLVE